MRIHAAKLLATVVCSLSLLGAAATPSEACFFGCLFGGCGTCGGGACGGGCPTGAYYGPVRYAPAYGGGCASGNCGVSSGYSSFYWGAPACSSCSPCGGVACASCTGGDCAVNSGTGNLTPEADPNWKKKGSTQTYAPEENNSKSQSPQAPGRTRPESGLNGTSDKPSGLQEDPESTGAFKPPMSTNNSAIEKTGAEEPSSEGSIPVNPKGTKSGPAAPRIPDDNESIDDSGAGQGPSINLDEKVAWRAAPNRKRLKLKPHVANARLIRLPEYPKSEWIPVDSESKVARK